MSFGMDKSKNKNKIDTTLETTQANIAREQYNDYLTRFRPVENELISEIGDDAKREATIADAGRVSDAAFDSASEDLATQQSRTGFRSVSPDATAVASRKLSLARALNNVTAQNATRQFLRDRQLGLAGAAVNLGRNLSASATEAVGTAAGVENAENARKRAANANEDAQTGQALGIAAGAAISLLSSREYKQNIRSADPGELLALILGIDPVKFEYRPKFNDPGTFIGMIAEDVPPEFASPDRTRVNAYNLIGSLVGAVQALTSRVAELEKR